MKEQVYENESVWPSSLPMGDPLGPERERDYLAMLNERRRKRVLIPDGKPRDGEQAHG